MDFHSIFLALMVIISMLDKVELKYVAVTQLCRYLRLVFETFQPAMAQYSSTRILSVPAWPPTVPQKR